MFDLYDLRLRSYLGWISKHIPEDEIATNCTIWCRVMREAFPELIHVEGYVLAKVKPFFSCFGYNYHEYLITERGDIVDPTANQFDGFIGKDNWFYNRCDECLVR